MNRRAVGLALATLICTAAADPAAGLLEALQTHYNAVRDLRGRFEQRSLIASLGREERLTGSVIVQRPDKMRWEYDAPDARVIVLEGDTLRIYVPTDKQLQIAPVGETGMSPTALGFLLGHRQLKDTFDALRLPSGDRPEVGLKLTPREDASFDYLELWIDPHSYLLRESVLVDLFANRTRLTLENVRENQGVVEEDFSITVPDDTEVIDLR